jgi:hypothetical protein
MTHDPSAVTTSEASVHLHSSEIAVARVRVPGTLTGVNTEGVTNPPFRRLRVNRGSEYQGKRGA